MLGYDGEYPAVHPIAKFWRFSVKNCKKSAVKHSIEKPILFNFVNLSPTFCPRLLEERLISDLFFCVERKYGFTIKGLRQSFFTAIFDINFINICSSFFITTIMVISFWDFLIFYQIFFCQSQKWNWVWLLVIIMVHTSCLMSCWTT